MKRGFQFKSQLFSTQVFDRGLKSRQRTASLCLPDGEYYDYLRKESASRLADRLEDIKRDFPRALELGSYRNNLLSVLDSNVGVRGHGGLGGVVNLTQGDFTKDYELQPPYISKYIKAEKVLCDEELLGFADKSYDMVISSLSMHWINDLPLALSNVKRVLKPDGVFIASVLGGSTLKELRHCFYLAEQERKGGISPHASPMLRSSDVAALVQAAGFSIPTVDVDVITVRQANIAESSGNDVYFLLLWSDPLFAHFVSDQLS
jgi:NADH dehydrogenase [ubiquinone] 1 alpha subcomplex assembly factor 5